MFQYFPGNYMWSLAVNRALVSGGHLGELHWACEPLREASGPDGHGDNEAWHHAWLKLARQLEGIASEAASAGHKVTARDHYMRAALYYQWAEAFLKPNDPRAKSTFAKHLEAFALGAVRFAPQIEIIEIPFEGKVLHGYFVPAATGDGPRPAVLLSDGLDGTKEEMVYVALALSQRGISTLAIDHPGQGATLRLSGLKARHDSEVAAGAAVDYLVSRSDVDSERIGIVAASMGGYYAPRAAAYEKRFKACVAWGAVYDYHSVWLRRFQVQPGKPVSLDVKAALGTTGDHILHILGVNSFDEALRALESFHLREAAQDIRCDILIVHGEDDKQTPLSDAQKLFDAIGSTKKTMRVFTRTEGGAAHVQLDRPEPALSLLCDWLLDHL
ncbi:alpha/beta hydrolase family protein [Cupriavidus sp. D39]|uniref:alpha/beta hydrolase family protein n=1 Tax=Cupriavidus sp. D39 TaxID=2997877 RepID=UPI00226E3443|nr:alpha/beta fold hydrolase [Cupriavidus sp. D39]MCY0854368.1 alpha/beta hydrolase [Cupriavidus sp. D39]